MEVKICLNYQSFFRWDVNHAKLVLAKEHQLHVLCRQSSKSGNYLLFRSTFSVSLI